MNYLVDKQLSFQNIQGSYKENAFSQILLQAVNQSYSYLMDVAPFEINSRYMAAYVNDNTYTCQDYVLLAVALDQQRADEICAPYPFTDLASIRFFTQPLFFGEPYITDFQTATGMNQAETDLLFATTDPTSFGGNFTYVQTDILKPFYCASSVDTVCSAEDLTNLQWGSA